MCHAVVRPDQHATDSSYHPTTVQSIAEGEANRLGSGHITTQTYRDHWPELPTSSKVLARYQRLFPGLQEELLTAARRVSEPTSTEPPGKIAQLTSVTSAIERFRVLSYYDLWEKREWDKPICLDNNWRLM